MSKKYTADKFEISGGTSSEFLLADGTTTTAPTGAVDSVNTQTGVVSLGLLELDDVGTDGTTGQVLTTNGSGAFSFTTVSGGGGGTVSSVNSQTGTVVLDTDDINEGTTNEYYTEARVSANSSVTSNTAKVGITTAQTSDITNNNSKISYTDASAVALNTAKVGITTQQSSDITTNNSKVTFDSTSSNKLAGISAGAEVNAVNTVNGQTGTVSVGLLELDDVGTDGTNGQVLTTNGSGAFSFTTVSGGGGGAAASTVLIKTNIVSATVNNALTFGSGSFFGTTLFESGTWTTTSSAITIPSDGFYSISFDIGSTSTVQRATPVFTITVNGTAIAEESSHAYIRNSSGGLNEASCVLTTVLDLSSGDTIGLASRRENNATSTITTVANKSKFSITQIAAPSVTTQVNTSLETAEAARNIVIGTSATPPSGTFIENTIYFQRAT